MNTAKILIIRFSSIGDIVLTTPVIRIIKKQLCAQVHFLTKKQYSVLLRYNPYIDRIIPLPENEKELHLFLRKEHYTHVIDLHNNLRSRRFTFGLSARVFRFNKINIYKWLLVNFKLNLLPEKHIVTRYLDACQELGVIDDENGLDFFHGLHTTDLSDFGLDVNSYMVYAIGGQHATKKLPVQSIINLINLSDSIYVLLGGPEDVIAADKIVAQTKAISLCGKTNLLQSALIIEHAKKVITHDSGMMHIAAAYKKQIISIWGNTIPEFGMYPYRTDSNSAMFEVAGLYCRPCSKIGFNHCPKGHFNCMKQQNLQEINERIQS